MPTPRDLPAARHALAEAARRLGLRLVRAAADERTLRRMAIGSTVLILALAWAAVGIVLALKWHDAIDAELRQNTNLARAFEEQTLRVLATADQATIRLRDAFVADPTKLPDTVRFANETGLVPRILVQLSLIDRKGRLLASNLDADGTRSNHVDLSTREHVRVHLAPEDLPLALRPTRPDDLFVGKPVVGKVSGRWTIQLSRRIEGAEGEILGVVVASLDPAYFEDVLRRADVGRGGSLTLVGTDRTVRARVVGGRSTGIGTTLTAAGPLAGVSVPAEGHYTVSSSIDQVERLVAYRRVATYPLYLMVATSTAEALDHWHTTRDFALALTLLLSLTVIAGCGLFVLALGRIEDSREALRRSEAAAHASNRAKTVFLANMSHEIRTPLTSIIGFADLLQEGLVATESRGQMMDAIAANGRHLLQVISDVLDVSKIEAGGLTIERREVRLLPLLHEVASNFGAQAREKRLAFDLDLPTPVPVAVATDPVRLKQILLNLCSNAIKFTERGGLRLGATWDDAARELVIVVADTGIGLSSEQLERLFQPFAQADVSTTRRFGGTGLGLYISRLLAEHLGGRLTVQSREGEGSRFTLHLPVDEATLALGMTEPRQGARAAPPALPDAASPAMPALRGRVLVAEDGPYNQRLIAAYIRATGAEVVLADNGEVAFEAALAERFDLVLMDIQMPVLDGIEATKMLRRAGCDTPIVALTANVMSEDIAQYREAGCTDVVAKPIDTRRLYAVLTAHLPRAGQDASSVDERVADVREQLARQFMAELPVTLGRIERALAAGAWDELRRTTHSLKGIAGSLGWPRLTELARPIEPAVDSGNHEQARELAAALIAAIREAIARAAAPA